MNFRVVNSFIIKSRKVEQLEHLGTVSSMNLSQKIYRTHQSDVGTARRLGGRSLLLHRTVVRPVAPAARLKWRLHAFASCSWTRWHARPRQQTITRLLLVCRLSVTVMVTGVGRWLRRHLQYQDRQVMVH